MHRDMGQPSLAESLLPETLGNNQRLERIDDAVDWGRFGGLVAGVYSACEGRPSYPPLTMVKVLLLEQWYNLSDPQRRRLWGTGYRSGGLWGWAFRMRLPITLRSAGSVPC